MSYLSILVQSLTFRRVHSFVVVDDLRTELCEAGQIPPASLGPLFAEACQKGYLTVTPATVKTTWRPGKGRLIRVYQVTSLARDEARGKRAA